MLTEDDWLEEIKKQIFEPFSPCPPSLHQARVMWREIAALREGLAARADLGRENERLSGERDRLVRALYMVGNVDLLAQCPCCLAERTNGEWHDATCALGAGVIE